MPSIEEAVCHPSEDPNVMERRGFLKAMGSALGLTTATTLFGLDSLRKVEAAVQSTAGLSPRQVARDESLWSEIQQAFTMRRSITNLDNAWTCASPSVVTEAVVRYTRYQEEVPAQQWVQNLLEPHFETIRASLARQFGCDREEIAIVRNATEALQTLLYGIDLKPGDEVLTTNQEYGHMVDTLEYRRERDGIILKEVELPIPLTSTDETVAAFEQAMTPRTRLIMVSHMGFTNGQIFPIRPICDLAHSRDIEVVVDGAHSFGHLDFKCQDLACDYFGTSLHKWLLAPKGTGMLYIPKDKIEKIPTLMSPPPGRRRDRWHGDIRKYEDVGTKPAAPFLAIAEALAFHNAIGSKRKEERLRYLTHYWAERLQALPNVRLSTSLAPEMSCAIATVGIEDIYTTPFRDYLWEEHQIQTARVRRGLRISPNLYTTLQQLDYFCELVEDVARDGLPEPYKSYQPRRRRERPPEQKQPEERPPG